MFGRDRQDEEGENTQGRQREQAREGRKREDEGTRRLSWKMSRG